MSTSPLNRSPDHLPALDGLRGLAVLVVMRVHLAGLTLFPALDKEWARRAVAVFFVLSGFLITRNLIAEKQAGEVSLVKFYARRMGRIFPLYYAVVAVMLVVYGWRWDVWSSANYSYNIMLAADPRPETVPIGAVWSLCVEEHFYLIWPLFFRFLPLRWSQIAALGIVVIGFASAAFFSWVGWKADLNQGQLVALIYHGTLPQMAVIGLGCLLAYAEPELRRRPWALLAMAALCFYAWGRAEPLVRHHTDSSDGVYWLRLANHVDTTMIALAIFAGTLWTLWSRWMPAVGLLEWRALRYVGAISYGLYLIHAPVFWWMGCEIALPHPNAGQVQTSLAVLIVFAVAALSYRYFESPLREWARRLADWRPTRQAAQPIPANAALSA